MAEYEEVDRFIGDAMDKGVTEPGAIAQLVLGRYGNEGRKALQEYRHGLKAEIAKGETTTHLTSEEIEYVASATAVDALVGDVLIAWPKGGGDAQRVG